MDPDQKEFPLASSEGDKEGVDNMDIDAGSENMGQEKSEKKVEEMNEDDDVYSLPFNKDESELNEVEIEKNGKNIPKDVENTEDRKEMGNDVDTGTNAVPTQAENVDENNNDMEEENNETEDNNDTESSKRPDKQVQGDHAEEKDIRQKTKDRIAEIEETFKKSKEQIFTEKVEKIKAEMERLKKGENEEFLDQLNVLERKKKEKLWLAQVWEEYQLACLQSLYEAELEQVESEYLMEKDGMREKMIGKLLEKKKKLQEEKDVYDIANEISVESFNRSVQGARKLRKRANEMSSIEKGRNKKSNGPVVNYELKDNEINEDVVFLRTNKTVSGRNEEVEVEAKVVYEDGLLIINEEKFEKNDQIFVECRNGPSYRGIITSLNSPDLFWIKREDGSKTKIYLSQLRIKNYILNHTSF
ncbi:Sds3-like domain-containing protein [Rozella allomycis CSF55]|uniref:Sds3-like domain-containing protein n=1 Tax=Rozella allomycis (strain CSF55) TaxID=988480 RepID=A0A075ATD3_ROZAC|nr:Sds3-like domain-containing protein [Rozella allomycis CSF55]|eukprot:EPZ33430.1 Sds3-like domain-containing protein [Rozella allomycis CSF55]